MILCGKTDPHLIIHHPFVLHPLTTNILLTFHTLPTNATIHTLPYPTSDAFHDGSGFLTHHLALTNGVEAAMRAVDPAVTMPYWDFTIEGEAIVQAGGKPSYFMEVRTRKRLNYLLHEQLIHLSNHTYTHKNYPRSHHPTHFLTFITLYAHY